MSSVHPAKAAIAYGLYPAPTASNCNISLVVGTSRAPADTVQLDRRKLLDWDSCSLLQARAQANKGSAFVLASQAHWLPKGAPAFGKPKWQARLDTGLVQVLRASPKGVHCPSPTVSRLPL